MNDRSSESGKSSVLQKAMSNSSVLHVYICLKFTRLLVTHSSTAAVYDMFIAL
jgi:hypothetical protein